MEKYIKRIPKNNTHMDQMKCCFLTILSKLRQLFFILRTKQFSHFFLKIAKKWTAATPADERSA
jgi:hypothetical protein